MSDQIEVIDLAPEPTAPEEEVARPPPPPLERQESVLAPVLEEEAEAPKPKRRGRPLGAKNKAKRKPPPPSEEDTEEYESEPPARNVRMQVPYRDPKLEMAQTLLDLMHAQAGAKASRRRQLYSSWF